MTWPGSQLSGPRAKGLNRKTSDINFRTRISTLNKQHTHKASATTPRSRKDLRLTDARTQNQHNKLQTKGDCQKTLHKRVDNHISSLFFSHRSFLKAFPVFNFRNVFPVYRWMEMRCPGPREKTYTSGGKPVDL